MKWKSLWLSFSILTILIMLTLLPYNVPPTWAITNPIVTPIGGGSGYFIAQSFGGLTNGLLYKINLQNRTAHSIATQIRGLAKGANDVIGSYPGTQSAQNDETVDIGLLSWSADGSHAVVCASASASLSNGFYIMGLGIYLIDGKTYDAKPLREIYDYIVDTTCPTISPDAKTILILTGDSTNPFHDLLYMDTMGNIKGQLTRDTAGCPGWFPDSSRVIFTVLRTGNWQIDTIKPDRSDVQPLISVLPIPQLKLQTPDAVTGTQISTTPSKVNVTGYEWSPDKQHIAFVVTSEFDRLDGSIISVSAIEVSNADGSHVTTLVEDAEQPYWIDNDTLAFIHFPGDKHQLSSIHLDGSNEHLLVDAPIYRLSLSPDRTMIAYNVFSANTTQLYLLNLSTMKTQRLLPDQSFRNPQFQP